MEKLKELRIAYECAVNYDYVPEVEEADELIQNILPDHLNVQKEQLEKILIKYQGSSPDNIVNKIIITIDEK